MWNIETIEAYCKSLCEEHFDMEFNCPVTINARLTRVLGRVNLRYDVYAKKYVPYKIEFSKAYIECATYESVQDTIKHELCHYVATAKSGANHGHDRYFKSLCHKVGCIDDGTKARHAQYNKPMPKREAKYIVECEDCGSQMKYYRKCKVTTYPHYYKCGKCGGELKVKQL